MIVKPLSYITLLSDKICPRFKEINCAWSGSCRLKSITVLHFWLVSASSLLNASCSLVSAWSFLEGFSDMYFWIFGNSAQRLMVCLPLVRHRVKYSFFLLSSSNLSCRPLMQAAFHLLTSATLSKWSNQLYQLSSLDKASGTKTGLRDAIFWNRRQRPTSQRNSVGQNVNFPYRYYQRKST